MARFIDADKIEYTARYVGMDEFAGFQTVAYKSEIDEIPTADVVPKGEVEKLQTDNSSLYRTIVKLTTEIESLNEKNAGLALACMCDCMANDDCLGHNEWKAIKAEVAREIFEEINERIINGITVAGQKLTLFNDKTYNELKKKYTEGEHDRGTSKDN